MRAVLQRVTEASVTIDGQKVGEIGKGIMVLFGMLGTDTDKTIDYMLDKVINLRIFEDEAGKMNLSILDIGGEVLSISQFTLYGDCRTGRRPSFTQAAKPEQAVLLYDLFNQSLEDLGLTVAKGQFQAHMHVDLTNDGPVTMLLDSKRLF